MNITVLDAASLGWDLSLAPLSRFGQVTVYPYTAPGDVYARVADCDILIQNKVKITADVLSHAKNLRLICETATGTDNIDIEAARARGIAVCNVPGYCAASVAQVTVAMVLSLACHLPAYCGFVASGAYSRGSDANYLVPVYRELAGMTWGVVGYGSIGQGVARVARALGCRVIYTKNTPDGSADCVDIDRLCRESDIISLHLPLSDKTRHLINRERLSLMKDGGMLINMARGAITDEEAVAAAVESGKLGGFGADVYSVEPFPAEHPFTRIKDRENVYLTPHMSWGAYEARVRCLDTICQNITAFLGGEQRNRVDI